MANKISNRLCVEVDCGIKHWAKNYCQYHYYSLYYNVKNRTRIRKIQKRHYWENLEKYRAKGRLDQSRRRGTLNYKFSEYKKAAKDHQREFLLSKEEFGMFWQKPCYYCTGSIQTIGLDRLDNDLGYLLNNIVSCCYECNKMKRTMSHDGFIELCRLIGRRPVPFAR